MASGYPPPLEGSAEVKEGFLCPLCLKDLQSFYQLQDHYEEEHSGDNRQVGSQLKSLVQKAKKAKDKLLKRDGDERAETSYESFYYGGVDPYMWEPQELGATRSHLDLFKKHRAARIDHYVIEVNKRIIRLEKLTSFDRINMDGGKIRALEKSVVPWVSDQDVPFCPDCGGKFNLRNRRHHCRLCGSIMCGKCMEFVPLVLAYKLTSGTREALYVAGSPGHGAPPGGGGLTVQQPQASRRGSISSLSSVSSVLEEKDEDRIRCCHHCMDALLRHQRKLDEKDHVPDIVKFYERLRMCMDKVDEKAPEYIRMAESLNAGETTYNLETAGSLRLEVQKYYEHIDALSKKILTLGLKDEVQPHPKTLQLQRMVRYSATLFVQEKLLGLMSLPTKENYEELKEKKRYEQQHRQAALEAHKRRSEIDKSRPLLSANGDAPRPASGPRMTKAGSWLPSSEGTRSHGELDDPLLQQIDNIESFLRQARAAGRSDEVAMLEENLRQLQDEFDAQQTSRAIELSRRLAQEESLQRSQISYLQQRELESRAAARERASDFGEGKGVEEAGEREGDRSRDPDMSPELRPPQTIKSFPRLPGTSPPLQRDECTMAPPAGEAQNSGSTTLLNRFDEEDSIPVEEDPMNPFSKEIQREHHQATVARDEEYNPFEDEEDDVKETDERQDGALGRNPFEEDDDDDRGNPFKDTPDEMLPVASTNPFEDDDDDSAAMDELIEEELLLQQIDNIRAYMFDAKLNGRTDEVELLSQNLKELQCTLQEQKRKTH
ncbi:rabenosyn-5 [Electrophorus electricus]|uniref:FYVE-type domain-containing protein n=1 Tax=Electrophorus electricus TaxID=8005 RepID=A0A4W4DQR8_ELEEL|nr:rabenosyn-5 [Electrophorus electricus]XP_026876955.2 rabenosyn-5 [Electrophorus electricus]